MRKLSSFWIAVFALALCLTSVFAGAPSEGDLRKFLLSAPNTYGWSPVKGDFSYDFFPDGRLHVQGKDGEATMWEGTWALKGDQVTMKVPALKSTKTYTAKADGQYLLLNEQRYQRYKP